MSISTSLHPSFISSARLPLQCLRFDPRTSTICARVMKSPFFWAVCLTASSAILITGAVTVLSATEAIAVSVAVVADLALIFLSQSPQTKKKLLSELSLCNSSLAGLIPPCIYTARDSKIGFWAA